MVKEVRKEIKIKTENTLRYLIRDFYELNKLLTEVQSMTRKDFSVSLERIKKDINSILKKMRGGLFSGEERIEYRLAQRFKRLQRAVQEASVEFTSADELLISGLMRRAEISRRIS